MNEMRTDKVDRKAYSPPNLHKWGNVADLTQLGGTTNTGDTLHGQTFGGSVHGVPAN